MSANLQTPPTDTKPVIAKCSYFVYDKNLYYVKNITLVGDRVLIENCKTNKCKWWNMIDFVKAEKEVINPSA